MKRLESIEHKLVGARRSSEGNDAFVDHVMASVRTHATNSRVIRTTNEQPNKETFIMKLRKLPMILLIAIVLAAVVGLGSISYAAVKIIEAVRPIVKESRINQNGKTEITIEKNACETIGQSRSERYELKEGVGLSEDDAARYINAHCHLHLINERLSLRGMIFASGLGRGTVANIQGNAISLKIGNEIYGPLDASVAFYGKDIQQVERADFKAGDEIVAYRDMRNVGANRPIVAVFKPIEALKYYDHFQQQNIRAVKACINNPSMDCVVASNYNNVTLVISQGGSVTSAQPEASKEMQGKLIEHTNDYFTLENNSHRITFQTPYDVVARYNQTTVYGLARYDSIYAKTNPELLKIAIGDTLSLFYTDDTNESSIPWNSVGVTMLMVEREPDDLSVLRKY